MNKKIKILLPLMTTAIFSPTFLISCSKKNSNPQIQNNNYIKSVSINGITNYVEGENLSLSASIDWNKQHSSSDKIEYQWSVKLSNSDKPIIHKTKDLKDRKSVV